MRITLLSCLLIFLCGCHSQKVVTTWKAQPSWPDRYQKILVVAVMPVSDSAARKSIEAEAVHLLSDYGYNAISAISVYGSKGLVAENEEATYLRLCNSGIDAVITFALVPKEGEYHDPGNNQYTLANNYYYDRLWAYKKIQEEMTTKSPANEYSWESILFDLLTLQAVYTSHTRSFPLDNKEKASQDMVSLVIRKMKEDKIIRKSNVKLKGF